MKKILTLSIALIACVALRAQGVQEYTDAYLWGQSQRNTSSKGSALATKSGVTYSLANVLKKADPKDIDVLCYYGKIGKAAPAFYLFSPMTPGLEVAWEKQGGTRPYCYFEGPQKDPGGAMALKNWKTRNATKLKKVAAEEYGKADLASLTFDSSEYMVQVASGDVVAFETAAGKKGLIKILSVEDDPERADKAGEGQYQKLNLNIKVQK